MIVDRKKLVLYAICFFAIFNDVLRIGHTDLSLFRVSMIFGWLIALTISINVVKKCLNKYIFIMIINAFQYFGFTLLNNLGITVNFARYLSYVYFSFCIFSVISFVYILFYYDPCNFRSQVTKFIKITSWIILFINLLIALNKKNGISVGLNVSNVNNYAMYLDAALVIFLLDLLKKQTISSIAFCSLAVSSMLFNDSKIAIIGAFVEFLIITYISRRCDIHSKFKTIFNLLLSIILFAVVIQFARNGININGYSFSEMIKDPLKHVFGGSLYEASNTSITYRVNNIIIAIIWLKKTLFLGIGYGNADVLMRNVLGDYSMKVNLYLHGSVSLHNAPLELLLDFGFIAVFYYLKFYKFIINKFRGKYITENSVMLIDFGLSLPIWILGPANLTSAYFFFIVITFLLITSIYDEKEVYENV